MKRLLSAQVYGNVAQRLEKTAAAVSACLRSTGSAHMLNFTATVFIMPIDFNYCTSDLARRACFQPAEPKRAVWLPNLGEVGPAHPSCVSSWCLSFFFFRLLLGLGWLPSPDFPGLGEWQGSAVPQGHGEALTSHRSASLSC